jgi:hypothetical protein
MEIIQKPIAFVKSKLPGHANIKTRILADIQAQGTHSIVESTQRLSNSDWYMPPGFNRRYDKTLLPLFYDHLQELQKELKIPFGLKISSYWFQQYIKNDYHDWHTHDCIYANVYYLDLPDGASRTSFYFMGEEFEIDVEEGDILTFPGSVIHRSKPNQSENIKTVVSFNISAKD